VRLHNGAGQCHGTEASDGGEQSVDDQEDGLPEHTVSQWQVSVQLEAPVFSGLASARLRHRGKAGTLSSVPATVLEY